MGFQNPESFCKASSKLEAEYSQPVRVVSCAPGELQAIQMARERFCYIPFGLTAFFCD